MFPAKRLLSARIWVLLVVSVTKSVITIYFSLVQLCEKHFAPSDFVTKSSYTDVETGRVVEVPLRIVKLKQDAIPSLFPNCPVYLSRTKTSARETPEEKRKRLEAASLNEALQLSIDEEELQSKKNKVTSFSGFLDALPSLQTSGLYAMETLKVFFLNLTDQHAPAVRSSVTVTSDLCVDVYIGETRVVNLAGVSVPAQLQDLRELRDVLQYVEQLYTDHSADGVQRTQQLLGLVSSLLEELICGDQPQQLHGWHMEVVKILKSQVDLVLSNAVQYPPDVLVFSSLIFTISPHAYRFLRNSQKVKLPHPETVRRLCSSYQVSPAAEQQVSGFLSYAKRLVKTMKEHERFVTLMMDEIHLQPYFDFKAGSVTGAAINSASPAKTAHVFMTQSLLSSRKDVVHIMPVAQMDAKTLHDFLRMLVVELESSGFKVIAVISDNNSINQKTMSFFSNPPSLKIVYQHPADPSRPLFFVVDPVHLLKCVRNNWINQRNPGRCMYFPDPKSAEQKPEILTASFSTLCQLPESEQNELLKLAPTLSLKALNPSKAECEASIADL